MSYTARELINSAFYLSGIVARKLQSVTGDQSSDGLRMLNGILAVKTANEEMIPYYKEHTITPVIGQEKYFVADLIDVETITYNLSTVRFPSKMMGRKRYFGSARPIQISSLPFSCRMERCVGGADLYFYFQPTSDIGPITLWGKFSFPKVATLDDDLSLFLDDFYLEYLEFSLAERICCEYNFAMQPQAKQKLDELTVTVSNISSPDLHMEKISCLQGRKTGFNWAMANLYNGYLP